MTQGQILPGSEFGNLLTRLATEAEVIVEIGTWYGGGSTKCLQLGMIRPGQKLFTVELDAEKARLASSDYLLFKNNISFIHGTIVLPEEFQPFEHPIADSIQFYAPEKEANSKAPYVLDQIPEKIDLLLIDSGEWTGDVEFGKLWKRSRVIALDDTHPEKVNKNVRNRQKLLDEGWTVIADNLNERNGYFAAKRP